MGLASLMLDFWPCIALHKVYARLPGLCRPESRHQLYFGYMLLAHLLIGIGLTWITGATAGRGTA